MILLTTLFALILRFFTDSDPPKSDETDDETDDETEGERKWATREQLSALRSSVETRLDRMTELLTGGEDTPEPKHRTLTTPASDDDELTLSASSPPETPENPEDSENESSETWEPKRKRAIWERNPPMRRVPNASTPDAKPPQT